MFTLKLQDFIKPDASPVSTASELAKFALTELAQRPRICISFAGVRGITTSFFNMLLGDLSRALSKPGIHERIEFQFDNSFQSASFNRSLNAILESEQKTNQTSGHP